MAGQLITLEGGEGAGKTTQAQRMAQWLNAQGQTAIITREPGGTALGEAIRAVLMQHDMSAMSELLLMFAARANHLEQVIKPALQQGQWVICDRFTDASFAYQGQARGLGAQPVKILEDLVQGQLRPDHVILFDLPPEVGLARRQQDAGENNRFDDEALEFHQQVRQGYLQRMQEHPQRYAKIDASQPADTVFADIQRLLDFWLRTK